MNPLQYLKKVGRAKADACARRAGLNPSYFNQICYGHRHASVRAAQRLVKHSGGAMSLLGILLHKPKASRKRAPRKHVRRAA